jgi:flagellar assembly protein FliH
MTSAAALPIPQFQTMTIEGSITEEELASGISNARAEGYREAESRLTAPLKASLENVERILDELSQFRRELFKESEADILELVRTVSKRILTKELSLQPEVMQEIVAKAISLVERQRKVSLQMNPADFEFFSRVKSDFMARFKGLEELEIGVDPEVERGSLLVRSKTLELDVRLDAMVDHLLSQIKSAKVQVNQVNDKEDSI